MLRVLSLLLEGTTDMQCGKGWPLRLSFPTGFVIGRRMIRRGDLQR